jgi:hypothetical protein
MSKELHWDVRNHLHEFREGNKGARWPILTAMLLHSNQRLRCWPSTDLLMAETGFSSHKEITEARRWLLDRQAIILVPYHQRVGEEKNLPERQFVYQLTGVFRAKDGTLVPLLRLSPEEAGSVIADLKTMDGIESSVRESMMADLKGIFQVEDIVVPKKKAQRRRAAQPTKERVPSACMNPMKDAIVNAFGWDWKTMTGTEIGLVQKVARELCLAHTAPADIPSLHKFCEKFTDFGPGALSKHLSEWRNPKPPATGIPSRPPQSPPPTAPRDVWAEPDAYGLALQAAAAARQPGAGA